MVWSRDNDVERPPLSVILPQLYLGAESDVTQERLASLGISYVLSVSRCSPQPSFLPCSRYLRIPIDDSLWDDLLPWIPQALHFIDAAMSSGASVLVHCAAGISRSPALAVAYIMYSLEMDLDHAYRFVKERRPSISPNFNFLGQLQHFQSTLSQKSASGEPFSQGQPDQLSLSGAVSHSQSCRNSDRHPGSVGVENAPHRRLFTDSNGNQQLTLQTLDLSPHQNQQHILSACEGPSFSPCEPVKPTAKPTQLHLPPSSASLLEKRKSLTLSLSPVGVSPPPTAGSKQPARSGAASKTVQLAGEVPEVKARSEDQSCRWTGDAQCSRAEVKEAGLLSPFSLTLNKLIGWGERFLLGGVFVSPVRMGQPALQYRC